jgi:hypothetical protein
VIDDTEPEDLYDRGDPIPIRLAVIGGIVNAATAQEATRARRLLLVARLLHEIVTEMGDDG